MICKYCGREFESKKRGRMGQQYCSLSCSSKASRETFTTQRTCPVCGQTFTATTPQAVYCGEECQRRATRDREQAKRRRRRNATHDQKDNRLSLAAVYQKAQGVCSVCGLPVPLHCERNDAWSRTKDHIVPITQGGDHSYANCQLAHRICNSIKYQSGEGFHIDWERKYESDPEKWGAKLIRLDHLLAEDRLQSASSV